MSGKKGSSSKITLGMLKGKSITTSVPTFAIRFHAEDEELEEIYPSAEETDDEAEKQEDDSNCSKGSSQMSSTNVQAPVTTSTSATTSTIHSRDPSPMKEYLKGFGKRSTSVDAGMIEGGSPAASSDTWRIFHEIKGKIAKTVEEKFGEMKSDRRSSTLAFSGGSNIRGGRLVGGGGSKDDSSINSDSEDISESSNKDQDDKSTKKNGNAEESPKKINNNKKDNDLEIPSTSQESTNLSVPATPKKVVNIGKSEIISDPYNEEQQDIMEEVESGVEVNEDMNLSAIEQESKEIDENVPTIDYRKPFPEYSPPIPKKKKKGLIHRLRRHWGATLFPFVGILIYYMIPLPAYISGFFSGVLISLGIGVVYTKISKISAAVTAPIDSEEGGLQVNKEFKLPDYSKLPILEVPPVTEHHQIHKYHGWMNELRQEYDPENYHLADTISVYVRLEGTSLRISHTKLRIPKRSMWNERPHRLKFYRQRIYCLESCKLKLLPDGLTRRRIWSKKYPICIVLSPTSKINLEDSLDALDKQTEDDASRLDDTISQDAASELDPLSKAAADDDDTEQQVSEVKDISATQSVPIDESDDDTFCHINKYELMEKCLYLFARTDREKEDWYRKLAAVMRRRQSPEEYEEDHFSFASEVHTPPLSRDSSVESLEESAADVSTGGGITVSSSAPVLSVPANDYMFVKNFEARDFKYLRFMAKFQEVHRYKMFQIVEKKICAALKQPTYAPKTEAKRKMQEQVDGAIEEIQEITADVMWLNAIVGRVLFDVLQNPVWLEKIQERLQRKLSTIKLPYFIEALVITELDLGHNLPMAHRVSHPRLNERGLWVDIDVTYDGTSCFTLETKLNLLKVKQVGGEIAAAQAAAKEETRGKSPMYDSDLDDSPESSDDDGLNEKSTSGEEKAAPSSSGSSGKKFINVVNKIAASKYFQQATEYKYIKKAMEGVSNTKLILTVEVNGLIGTLAVNIPPPPSDRLWYGFRGNPRLWLQARPKLGERQVNISQVTTWIEKQLCLEFQKKFVLPNMDDLVIPPMTTDLPD